MKLRTENAVTREKLYGEIKTSVLILTPCKDDDVLPK